MKMIFGVANFQKLFVNPDLCTNLGIHLLRPHRLVTFRYKSNSERKLLIYIDFENCLISVHFVQSLDLQGFGCQQQDISTKLSTVV
jgi:hypothetical protein